MIRLTELPKPIMCFILWYNLIFCHKDKSFLHLKSFFMLWWRSGEIAAPYLSTFWENSWRPLGSGILSATSTIGPQVWPQPCYCKVYYPQEKLQIYASVQVYCNIWVADSWQKCIVHDNKQVVEAPRWRVIKCYPEKNLRQQLAQAPTPILFPFMQLVSAEWVFPCRWPPER